MAQNNSIQETQGRDRPSFSSNGHMLQTYSVDQYTTSHQECHHLRLQWVPVFTVTKFGQVTLLSLSSEFKDQISRDIQCKDSRHCLWLANQKFGYKCKSLRGKTYKVIILINQPLTQTFFDKVVSQACQRKYRKQACVLSFSEINRLQREFTFKMIPYYNKLFQLVVPPVSSETTGLVRKVTRLTNLKVEMTKNQTHSKGL